MKTKEKPLSVQNWKAESTDLSQLFPLDENFMVDQEKDTQQESKLFVREKRTWVRKFRDAFRGLGQSVKQQSSYKVHFCFAVIVPIVGIIVQLGLLQWCMLLFCITVVFAAEMFNTSIETLARAVTLEQNSQVGRALDIASGAVLTVSLGATFIGAIIFVNAIIHLATQQGH